MSNICLSPLASLLLSDSMLSICYFSLLQLKRVTEEYTYGIPRQFDPNSRMMARKVDKVSRAVFPLGFALFNLIYWSILLSRQQYLLCYIIPLPSLTAKCLQMYIALYYIYANKFIFIANVNNFFFSLDLLSSPHNVLRNMLYVKMCFQNIFYFLS